ncbi:MAG: hypothetical protein JWR28_114 [Modestobacter sp.]|jgi:hypothetical protein|nr:hypothetical protein [Modestobacter sp.]
MTTEKPGNCSGGSVVRLPIHTIEDVRSTLAPLSLSETEDHHHGVLAVVTFRQVR